ncbi:hypothetical protein BAE44_0015817, partial [Dichanthelium oligosanthes]
LHDTSLSLYGSSGCIGNLSKSQSLQDSKLKGSLRKRSRYSSTGNRRRWQSGLEAMENNASISVSLEGNISSMPNSIVNDSKISMENGADTSFINHGMILLKILSGEIKWLIVRVPTQSCTQIVFLFEQELFRSLNSLCLSHRSWCTTYDDLLSSSENFPQPIPLSEMVDFLVDIWHEEGLYD